MKILVAYNDRARSSKEALQVAKTHAKAYQAQILVATSADPSRSEKDLMSKDEAEKVLADIQQELEDEGFACSTHLLILGYSRAEDLLHFAREKDVDEIVVGVEKRSKVGKFFSGIPGPACDSQSRLSGGGGEVARRGRTGYLSGQHLHGILIPAGRLFQEQELPDDAFRTGACFSAA